MSGVFDNLLTNIRTGYAIGVAPIYSEEVRAMTETNREKTDEESDNATQRERERDTGSSAETPSEKPIDTATGTTDPEQ